MAHPDMTPPDCTRRWGGVLLSQRLMGAGRRDEGTLRAALLMSGGCRPAVAGTVAASSGQRLIGACGCYCPDSGFGTLPAIAAPMPFQ